MNQSAPIPDPAPTSAMADGPSELKPTWQKWLIRVSIQSAAVLVVVAIVLFAIGLAQRSGWIRMTEGVSDTATGHDSDQRYICPMMCTPPSSQPGRCPVCGMELVAATNQDSGDGISVTITPAARRLAGIQTATSKLSDAQRTIRTIGRIEFDESQLATISAYVDGRLEKLYADYLGVRVQAGDDLALIYSPQLYSAQTEFITSLTGRSVGRFDLNGEQLSELAREKLSELGMTDQQIQQLQDSGKPQSRIRIKSPQTGTVITKSAVEGDYVKTGQPIYRIADLSTVWMMLDLFPDDAATVRFGQQVEAEIDSVPGEVFTGRVAFIDPTVDAQRRTVRVRVEMLNLDGKLRPGDYATARIAVPAVATEWVYDPALAGKYISPMHPQVIRDGPGDCPLCGMDLVPTTELGYATEPLPHQQVVTVPRSAVLMTGDQGVIYIETEPGRFEIRRVTLGPLTDTEAVILGGLAAGETVATQGNFLIDSQMQLAGNPSLLDPQRAPRFASGPLQLPPQQTVTLTGSSGQQFDRGYGAYFDIQTALAADQSPPAAAVNTLLDALTQLEMAGDVPDAAQRHLSQARRAANSLGGSLQDARSAFRTVSHAMLQAAMIVRGPDTAGALSHYYCPMVPGGGGDWMQPGGRLANPYWGSEMFRCGEVVSDLSLTSPPEPSTTSEQLSS